MSIVSAAPALSFSPVLDGGAECSWFTPTPAAVTVQADDLRFSVVGHPWRSFDVYDGRDAVAGGSEPCDDVRSDELDEAGRDARDAMARMPLGTTAGDAVEVIRGRWELTDAECALIVDRLCGA